MKKPKFIDAVLLAFALAAIIVVAGALVAEYTIPSTGTVKTCKVEMYWDQQLTKPATQVDWGLVEPVAPITKTLYIHNPGIVNLNLTFYVSDWQPENASQVVSVGWNLEGRTLLVGETKTVTLTLYTSMDMQNITSFSNILHFVGTET